MAFSSEKPGAHLSSIRQKPARVWSFQTEVPDFLQVCFTEAHVGSISSSSHTLYSSYLIFFFIKHFQNSKLQCWLLETKFFNLKSLTNYSKTHFNESNSAECPEIVTLIHSLLVVQLIPRKSEDQSQTS